MTVKELMTQLDPSHTEADGQIVCSPNVQSPWDVCQFDMDAIVSEPRRDGLDLTWQVTDSSGTYRMTETGNGDVMVNPAIAQAEGE